MNEDIQIQQITKDTPNLPEIANILARAFCDDPVALMIFGDLTPEERIEKLSIAYVETLKVCIKHGTPYVVTYQGKAAGATIVYPPKAYPPPLSAQLKQNAAYIAKAGTHGVGKWVSLMTEIEKDHPKDPHYYLEFIGIDPDYQGKHVGSALLEYIFARKDIFK